MKIQGFIEGKKLENSNKISIISRKFDRGEDDMKLVFFSIFFLTVTMITPQTILSAPTQTIRVVNDDTQQCGEFFSGDEFFLCELPGGWTESDNCPYNYEDIGRVKGVNCQESEWSKQMRHEDPQSVVSQEDASNNYPPARKRHQGFSCFSAPHYTDPI